jgi:hypothetical protein
MQDEEPKFQRFWSGHRYLLNSQHKTKQEAHREAASCRRSLGGLARVVRAGEKYYVYLANARPKAKLTRGK